MTAPVAGRPVPPGFVALDEQLAIDPRDVQVIAGAGAGTRIYVKGNRSPRAYFEVARPIHEVMRALGRIA